MAITLTKSWKDIGTGSFSGLTGCNVKLQGRYTSQDSGGTNAEFRVVTAGSGYWSTTSGSNHFTGYYTNSASLVNYPNYTYSGTTILSKSGYIAHESDGTKSISLGATGSINANGGTRTYTISQASITLPTIKALSTATINKSTFTAGVEDVVMRITQNVASYTQNVYMLINGVEELIMSDAPADTDITIETHNPTLANKIYQASPNSNEYSSYFIIKTYDNGTLVGSVNKPNYTAVITNANPSFNTTTYNDANGTISAITQNNQYIVQNKSTLQFNITNAGVTKYAGGLSKVKVKIGETEKEDTITGTAGVSKTFTWGTLDADQNVTARVTLIDSRGNSTSQNVSVNVIAYTPPYAVITLARQHGYYTDTDYSVDSAYSPVTIGGISKNSLTIKYKTKQAGGSYGTATTYSSSTTLSLTNSATWYVQTILTDTIGSTTIYEKSVSAGTPRFFIDTLRDSVGVGCFPDHNNSLDVNGDIYSNGVNVLNTLMSPNKNFDFKMLNIAVDRDNPFPDIISNIGTLTKTTGFINYSYNNGEHVMIGYVYPSKTYGALICLSYNNNYARVYSLNNGTYSSSTLFKSKNAVHSYSSSQQSTTSALAVTDMSITLTTHGGDVLVTCTAPLLADGGTSQLRLYVDGSNNGAIARTSNKTGKIQVTGSTLVTGLSAGSHTFAMYFAPQNSSYTAKIDSYCEKSMSAVEI